MYIHIGWVGSTQHFFYVANVSTVLTLWDLERSTAAEYAERKRNLHKCRAATRRRPFLQIHNPADMGYSFLQPYKPHFTFWF